MKNNKVVKIVTVVGFIVLITMFIAFKVGAFDDYVNAEDKDKVPDSKQPAKFDSLTYVQPEHVTDDTQLSTPTMMSTSKSMIIVDQKMPFPFEIDSNFDIEKDIKASTKKPIGK